ncbi:DUF3105 domain-containing protein [Paenibacillus cremeus]|uniref:DUF3105 domain-containing protein n=1 Tax=Paenibacillus cremeus TaxID=2163881 RepID=A0A559K6W2_9BACL|nr:DUF3105 domain-containing protein [Paenibacillus cremeus]TVY07823.1 DUF3105 domain-containing protein [Paenibacillus cremeus]
MTSILLYVGIVFFAAAIAGYFYASKLRGENTSRLKKAEKAALTKKSKGINLFSNLSLVVSLVLVGVYFIQLSASKYSVEKLNYKADIQVTTDKDYGRDHTDDPVKYELKIPTSGAHSPHDLKFGFYKDKPAYEKLVHNLEHGDVIVYYKKDASAELKDKLEVLSHYRRAGSGILAVPSEDIPAGDEVVVTAWTKTMELKAYDEAKAGTFIYQFLNHGPEVIPPEVRQGGGTM